MVEPICSAAEGAWPPRLLCSRQYHRPVGHRGTSVGAGGYTLIEALVAVLVASLAVALGAPALALARHDIRAGAATTYMAALVRQARVDAAKHLASVGIRIVRDAAGAWQIQSFVDGDGDGVRTADIEAGVDRARGQPVRLEQLFPGIDFGILPGVAPVEPGDSLADGNPVRLGVSGILSCAPPGGCSGGSVYLTGPSARQMVIRVLGGTGRVRSGRYIWNTGRWLLR